MGRGPAATEESMSGPTRRCARGWPWIALRTGVSYVAIAIWQMREIRR